jgi:hypothetical protein
MSRIEIELDGEGCWPGLEFVNGELTGIALLADAETASGNKVPSLTLRVQTKSEQPSTNPLIIRPETKEQTVLFQVKVQTMIQVLELVRSHLVHLQAEREKGIIGD